MSLSAIRRGISWIGSSAVRRRFLIGTRGSLLALAQANEIKKKLKTFWPKFDFPLVVIKTTGDEFQTVELFKKNNTGVFTKALEKKLIGKKIDIAVHSLKDLPTQLPKGLCLAAFPKRQDVRDVLISRGRFTLKTLPPGAWVGTGSPRRKSQLRHLRPDLKLIDIRGNLDTRVAKVLKEKKYDAVLVARAGLLRVKKYLKHACSIPPWVLLPAVGQAALGIEARENDGEVLRLVKKLNHERTQKEALAERELLRCLQGGCRVPVGVFSSVKGEKIFLRARVFSVKNGDFLEAQMAASAAQPEKTGRFLARKLLKKGALKFLKEARKT